MYGKLIEKMRCCSDQYRCGDCRFVEDCAGEEYLLDEAADAIEELVRKEKFHAFLWNTIQPNEMEQYISMYNAGNEKVETK